MVSPLCCVAVQTNFMSDLGTIHEMAYMNMVEDNISEPSGLGVGEVFRKAEDRAKWRKVVARSTLMP